MIIYKLCKIGFSEPDAVMTQEGKVIPFDVLNGDYEFFKYQINHDEAQLEDADGNLMSPEAAKAYVATLP